MTAIIHHQQHRRVAQPRHWGALGVIVLGTALTAVVGTLASIGGQSYYLSLRKPAWAPSPAVFGPVWTALYVLMTVGAWFAYRAARRIDLRPIMTLYGVQLFFSALWIWCFFRWHSGIASIIDIVVLWLLVVTMIQMFWRRRHLAGALLIPYIGWVSFATALTVVMWRGNPGIL